MNIRRSIAALALAFAAWRMGRKYSPVVKPTEDGRTKFLRLNNARLQSARDRLRLMERMRQDNPTVEDLNRIRQELYAQFEQVNAHIDHYVR